MIVLLIMTLSSNKLEGMAVTKLSSLIMLGAAALYFLPSPLCYCLSFLPSFWVGKGITEQELTALLPSLAAAGCWIIGLLRRYCKKF